MLSDHPHVPSLRTLAPDAVFFRQLKPQGLVGWSIVMRFDCPLLISDIAIHAIHALSDGQEQDWERIAAWFRHRLAEARRRR